MKRSVGFLLVLAAGTLALQVWADETIEMATYVPAPASSSPEFDRLHSKRATIGDAYKPAILPDSTIPDGSLFVSGNVGIGTPNPGATLEVNGQVKITGGAPGQGKVLVSDANGLASWGSQQNSALQMVTRGHPGQNFTATTAGSPPVTSWREVGPDITITPRSTNSTLVVEITFQGRVDRGTTGNYYTEGDYIILETTGGGSTQVGPADPTKHYRLVSVVTTYNGSTNLTSSQDVPSSVRALVNNTGTTARSFRMYTRGATGIPSVPITWDITQMVLTVTEVQN